MKTFEVRIYLSDSKSKMFVNLQSHEFLVVDYHTVKIQSAAKEWITFYGLPFTVTEKQS